MSRTRIVRGKIFEKVQDHLTYFSDKSILEASANVYAENSQRPFNSQIIQRNLNQSFRQIRSEF